MAKWQIVPLIETADIPRVSRFKPLPPAYPPPGLLLSLGDGSAVERSAEDLAFAWAKAASQNVGEDSVVIMREMLAALIQQAQEARDAG